MKFLITFLALFVFGTFAGPLNPQIRNVFDTQPYIIGGTDAQAGEVPSQVSLQQSSHFCGGVIIADEWILTAAHCVTGVSASNLNVRYNSLNYNTGGQLVKVSQVITHENYNSWTIDNDIALLKTATKLTLGQTNANALPLPAQGSSVDLDLPITSSGWGLTSEGGSLSPTLKVVSKPKITQDECRAAFNTINHAITDNMLCAGHFEGGKSACNGDSGGPAVSNGKLVGLVSFSVGCARPDYPGVYTRVGMYVDWIKSKGVSV